MASHDLSLEVFFLLLEGFDEDVEQQRVRVCEELGDVVRAVLHDDPVELGHELVDGFVVDVVLVVERAVQENRVEPLLAEVLLDDFPDHVSVGAQQRDHLLDEDRGVGRVLRAQLFLHVPHFELRGLELRVKGFDPGEPRVLVPEHYFHSLDPLVQQFYQRLVAEVFHREVVHAENLVRGSVLVVDLVDLLNPAYRLSQLHHVFEQVFAHGLVVALTHFHRLLQQLHLPRGFLRVFYDV